MEINSWKEDSREDILLDKWSSICTKAQTQTVNTRLKLMQYIWLMRTYVTPAKLINKYNSTVPDICYKCNHSEGTVSLSVGL